MKKNIFYILAIGAALAASTSCLKDLDTLPLNETDTVSETAYVDESSYLEGLTYVNAYWLFVSQNDPGSSDLNFNNAGQSELCRQYELLNELSAGSYGCSWGDSYINPIQTQTWNDADNNAIIAVYTRCMKGITLANEYLLQTSDSKLESRGHNSLKQTVAGYRAEARFHRAMYYYIMMDMFGNPPFATEESIGGDNPEQIKRADLYKWIESECLELLADGSAMPKKGEVAYPRPTQGSVAGLLARMYLNAEVYTGTAQWEKAKEYAEKVIEMGYKLHDDYHELFMDDNTTNGAAEDEFIFGLDYDNQYAQSWGGTTTLCSASFNDAMSNNLVSILGLTNAGTTLAHSDNWNGYHVSDDYVSLFNLKDVVWGGGEDKLGYNLEASDKRAFFYNGGQTKEYVATDNTTGWRCWKWMGLSSDGTIRHAVDDAPYNYKLSSSDFPVMRLAEMYLIYAEADARLNGGVTTDAKAKSYIQALRDRAGVDMPSSITTDWLLDERARELMWEGHRRTDLIRYGKFSSDSNRNIYPIIMSDLNANPNLTQNPGY